MSGYQFLIGADPEIFVAENNKFVSAHGLVNGDKVNPLKVYKGAVQVDGMALEFNIDPASSKQDFLENIEVVSKQLGGMIGDKQFIQDCSVFFEDEDIKGVPLANLILGCSEDYNGYSLSTNPAPDANMKMRTAGGHIHIGGFEVDDPWEEEHFFRSADIAKAMDKYVGVYSLLWDKDDKRRLLYGKAGSFRPKKYGMEYRTLSNAWIFSSDLISFIYDKSKEAVEKLLDGEIINTDMYQKIIDTSNRAHEFFSTDKDAATVKEIVYG